MNLEALVAPLRADVVSGATTIARTAADVFQRGLQGADVEEVDELREILGRIAVRILDAQPAMAPLYHLGARILIAAGEADDPATVRTGVIEAADAFRAELEAAGDEVARQAVDLLPRQGRIVTLSASSTVARSLLEAHRAGHRLEVVCLESRPLSEGRRLARRLAGEGISVTYAVDAAAWSLVPGSAAVVFGADSVGDRGVVNKIGSRSLAAAGREARAAVHVLTDRTKLLPPGVPQPVADERPGDEVWKSPGGIRIWNRYFEPVPVEMVDAVILEDGALSATEVADARSDLPVPEPLREWARQRRRGSSGQEPETGSRV